MSEPTDQPTAEHAEGFLAAEAEAEAAALLAIDTEVVDTLIQKVLDSATATNVKLEHIIEFGQLLMERRKVGPFPPAMKTALLDALSV